MYAPKRFACYAPVLFTALSLLVATPAASAAQQEDSEFSRGTCEAI